jgi:hypothetical protein
MPVGRGDQEVQWQAGAAAEEGMYPIATQERTGMVSGGMAYGRVGICSAPSQERSAVNDEITSSDQTAAHGMPDAEHEEGLKGWGSCRLPALIQLGGTGNTWRSIGSLRQTTGQRQGRPTPQPVMYVLVGEPPQRFQ